MSFNLDLADVKPSPMSFVLVGLMAVLFIVLAKYALNRWNVPGLTDVINAV